MRLPAVVIAIATLLIVSLTPAQAQTTFTQGQYNFEDVIASMTYGGAWSTGTISSPYVIVRSTSAVSGNVSFLAEGKTLVIWRYVVANAVSSRMDVCIGASCTSVINESTQVTGFFYPVMFAMPSGTNTITITRTLGTIYLDYFMILQDPAIGAFPTPVPTATIIPSPTPASTTTPQPTPTPQPTATAYTLPGAMIMIDPARSYGGQNGQITATEYSATAADIHLSNLLSLIFFSMWGMFLFAVFVLIRYREKGKPK